MTVRTDVELVQATLAADEAAFAVLLERYLSLIKGFLFQLTRDREVAEDLTQETFIKAWKHLRRFDQKRSFKTWLFTIAHNNARDFFRKHKEISFTALSSDEENNFGEDIADQNILSDEVLARSDVVHEIDQVLAEMPVAYRTLLLLHFREDLSLQEIATMLGEPYNTIKSRYFRSIKWLQKGIIGNSAP